jgi:hypothetical protein
MLDSAAVKQQRYAATYTLYKQAFPPAPPLEFWPAPAVTEIAAPGEKASGKRSAAMASLHEGPAESANGGGSAPKRTSRRTARAAAAAAVPTHNADVTAADSAAGITIGIRDARGDELLFSVSPSIVYYDVRCLQRIRSKDRHGHWEFRLLKYCQE